MNYLEWNNLIAMHFFNNENENANKEIYLYITKDDIIKIGGAELSNEGKEAIWNDFINAICESLLQCNTGNPIIKSAVNIYKDWIEQNEVLNKQQKYSSPPYIIFLVLTILPLTESHDNINPNNYYDQLRTFLSENNLPNENINTSNFKKLDVLWENLLDWLNNIKSGQLGIIQLHNFGNPHWRHIGKPLSQCLLSPLTISKLPEVFNESSLTPYSNYSNEHFRKIILHHNNNLIKLKNFVERILIDNDDDTKVNDILEIIKKEYKKWDGETEKIIITGGTEKKTRGFIIAKICLQLNININNESVEFSNRLLSKNEYPESLTLGNIDVKYEKNGFSTTLKFDINNFNDFKEFKDENNKWIARFPQNDIRLFINAGYYQLSNSFFIETGKISRVSQMYLLCKSEKRDDILEWGKSFIDGDFKEINFDGIPEGFNLFWFKNPQSSHSDIEILKVLENKTIVISGGMPLKSRTYLNIYPPVVNIENADGKEKVFIEYTDNGEKLDLEKDNDYLDRFHFTKNVKCNKPFKIKIEGQQLPSYSYSYEFSKNDLNIVNYSNELPSRDKFGKRTINSNEIIATGNNVNSNGLIESQKGYVNLFRKDYNLSVRFNFQKPAFNYTNDKDALLYYLSNKKTCKIKDFFDNFEYLYNKINFRNNSNENLIQLKKTALYQYSNLGFIECFYDTKQIFICPPQLFLIPSEYGRKAILAGARNKLLVDKLKTLSKNYKITFNIESQKSNSDKLLLPQIITLHSCCNYPQDDDKNLVEISKECGIAFNKDIFNQIGFLLKSSSLEKYKKYLLATNETQIVDYPWGRYIFNPVTFNFEINNNTNFDRTFVLTEYKLDYNLNQKLWISNHCYNVDKNWGRYLILREKNINVFLYHLDNKKLAIPVKLPLPFILAKAIIMLSGEIPQMKDIAHLNKNILYFIFNNIPELIAENISNKLGQKLIKKNF